ncbi:MAG TPA: c(7)-type cytochrome triheme domain-containing protein [Nitrospirota bacterium]|nr:c(7)-type cytochrome triheme domain-containing protein [Nitrospirota bacterium]
MKIPAAISVFAALALLAAAATAQEGVTYPKEIIFKGTGKAVVFSHKKHTEDFGIACDGCHGKLFEAEAGAAKGKGDFTMRAMYEGKYCGACHNGSDAFAADDFMQCERCHYAAPEAEEAPRANLSGPKEEITLGSDDSVAVFRHESHQGKACNKCHTSLFPMKKTKTVTTMDEINAGKSCGTCHNGKAAFDQSQCSMCHPKM